MDQDTTQNNRNLALCEAFFDNLSGSMTSKQVYSFQEVLQSFVRTENTMHMLLSIKEENMTIWWHHDSDQERKRHFRAVFAADAGL